jgi:hypothetical protein
VDTHPVSVSQRECRPVNFLSPVEIWLVVCRLGSVKMDFCMGTVTEGFIFRLPAAAQGVPFLQGECLYFMPGTAVALSIVPDLFYLEGDTSGNDIGAVVTHPDFLRIVLGERRFFFCWGHDVPAILFLVDYRKAFLIVSMDPSGSGSLFVFLNTEKQKDPCPYLFSSAW